MNIKKKEVILGKIILKIKIQDIYCLFIVCDLVDVYINKLVSKC